MTSSVFVNDETPHESCGRLMAEYYINSICQGSVYSKSVCIRVCSHIFGATCDPTGVIPHPSQK